MSFREPPKNQVWDWNRLSCDTQQQILSEVVGPVNHLSEEQHLNLAYAFRMKHGKFFDNLFPPTGGPWTSQIFRHRIIGLPFVTCALYTLPQKVRYALVPARRADLVLLFTSGRDHQKMYTYEVVWENGGWQCGKELCEQRIPECECKSVSDDGSHIAHVYRSRFVDGIILRVFRTLRESNVKWGYSPCGEKRMPGINTSSDALFNPTGTLVAIFVADDDAQEIHVYDCSLNQVKLLSLDTSLDPSAYLTMKCSLQDTLHWADADTLRWLVVERTGVLGVHTCSALPDSQPTKNTEVVLEGLYRTKRARVVQAASGTIMAVEYYLTVDEPRFDRLRPTKAAMLVFDPTPRVAYTGNSIEELLNIGNDVNIAGPYAYKILPATSLFARGALEISEIVLP